MGDYRRALGGGSDIGLREVDDDDRGRPRRSQVFLRWTFQPLEPTEADQPTWIAAGAVAITCFAGSNLLATRTVPTRVDRLAPLIEGLVILAWPRPPSGSRSWPHSASGATSSVTFRSATTSYWALAAWLAAFAGMLVQGAGAALRQRARRT